MLPPRVRKGHGICSHHSIQPCSKVWASAIRQEKEIKDVQIGEEERKLSICGSHDGLYKNLKDSTKQLLELLSLAQWQDTEISCILDSGNDELEIENLKAIIIASEAQDT